MTSSVRSSSQYTPMMRQYLGIKEQNQDSILFFRLGDFYEMFFEDAIRVSEYLDLVLTGREAGSEEKVPMCGIPYHAAEGYIAKLIKGGFKVAICEQTSEATAGKGIVRREVVRRFSPGTLVSDQMLTSAVSNYLASVIFGKQGFALAYADLSTGEFKVSDLKNESELLQELQRVQPSELLCREGQELPVLIKDFSETAQILISSFDEWAFGYDAAFEALAHLLGAQSLDGFGLKDKRGAIVAAGSLVLYLQQMQGKDLKHINRVQLYSPQEYMLLDAATQRNLEIVKSLSGHDKNGTLLSVLDHTVSPVGARQLRRSLLQPLRKRAAIEERLGAVELCVKDSSLRDSLRAALKGSHDPERIIGRVDTGQANARDLQALSQMLGKIPAIKTLLAPVSEGLLHKLNNHLQSLPELAELLERAICEEPPVSVREGAMIREGFNEDLDELRRMKGDAKNWLLSFQQQQMKQTGIKSLKVKFNKVFGYYIEVTKANLAMVPEEYIRKQTTVNAERFITPELKEKEALILGADDRIAQLEFKLFEELRARVMDFTAPIQSTARAMGLLDMLLSFAQVAEKHRYCRPILDESTALTLRNGRHPVVEPLLVREPFVPNDTDLNEREFVSIITGPNMAGKSTYIRQVALIVYMAQCGSFVPADAAQIGLVDRIFTRVGAADELARGQSTFMMEMTETANILNNATERSLVILDEVGRGTSTFDGVSIAWSIVEYVHDQLRAKTIFATHYHELTALESRLPGVVNYNVACREMKNDVVFLRKIVRGGTDKSYGIHVAKLAGVPAPVLQRARVILKSLEQQGSSSPSQLLQQDLLFAEAPAESAPQESPVLEKLSDLNPNAMTPMEALLALQELKELAQQGDESYVRNH